MTIEQLNNIVESYINGNISDFKASVREMDKIDLVRLIDVARVEYQIGIDRIIRSLLSVLK